MMRESNPLQGRRSLYISHGAGNRADGDAAYVDWFIIEPREAPGQQMRRLAEGGRPVYKLEVVPWEGKWRRRRRWLFWDLRFPLGFVAGSLVAHYAGFSRSATSPVWLSVVGWVLLAAVLLFALWTMWRTRALTKALKQDREQARKDRLAEGMKRVFEEGDSHD